MTLKYMTDFKAIQDIVTGSRRKFSLKGNHLKNAIGKNR